jgi:hypothetical protein
MACGDDDFQQQWRQDLVVQWCRRVFPEIGMGR